MKILKNTVAHSLGIQCPHSEEEDSVAKIYGFMDELGDQSKENVTKSGKSPKGGRGQQKNQKAQNSKFSAFEARKKIKKFGG